MKIGERLLLIFMTLVFFAIVIFVGTAIWYTPIVDAVFDVLDAYVYIKVAVSVVLFALLILSFRTMLVSSGKTKEKTMMASSNGEGGIYINLDTVSLLAKNAVKKIDGVRDLRIKTIVSKDGVNIAVKVALAVDVVIPEVSVAIQQSVKGDVETLCGINVKKVTIQVDDSLQTQSK